MKIVDCYEIYVIEVKMQGLKSLSTNWIIEGQILSILWIKKNNVIEV